ncbi:hypothetical protein ZOSMA_71G00360, partial [Zostera marina]
MHIHRVLYQTCSGKEDGEEPTAGNDVAAREKTIGADGGRANDVDGRANGTLTNQGHVKERVVTGEEINDADMQEVTHEEHNLVRHVAPKVDDMAQQENPIGTDGFHLNDVEQRANEKNTADTNVEGEMTVLQFNQNTIPVAFGSGRVNPNNEDPEGIIPNLQHYLKVGSGGNNPGRSENQIAALERKTEEPTSRGMLTQREEDRTERSMEVENTKTKDRIPQRKGAMQHATEDEQQELLLPDSTALQAMGVDNLSKLAELLWENGKWYGVGENSAMSQYDLAKAIESGTDLAWNRSEMYGGESDMYGGKLEQIKEAWLGKMMENYDKHHDHLKIKVRQLRDLISKIGIKSTRGTANLALWVHPMNQLNQAHVGSDTLGQVAPGNKLTKLSSDATQAMRELVKSAESNHQGGQPNLTETGPSQIEGNQDELNRKLAEAGSNPFKVGSGKSGTSKKGGGSLNKKKEGDPTRISKGGKSNKSNRRDRDSATGKTTGSAPMTT